MPTAHAAVGGSSIARTLRCPGWIRLAEKLPRSSTPAADRGTMLHYALQKVLEKGAEPSALVGITHAGVRLESGDARAMLLPARAMTYKFIGDVKPRMEVRVRFERNVWGTADLLAKNGHTGYLADYKFGTYAVPAEGNEQLLFYAAAALERGHFGPSPREVKAAIIQPAVTLTPLAVTYTPAELTEFAARVRAAATVALGPNAPVIPGEVQCKWCPVKAAGVCPAISKGGGSLTDALQSLSLRI